MKTTNKTLKGFIIIAILAILWNVIGVMSYLVHAYMPAEAIAKLPQNQQEFMNNTPTWRMASFAIATFGGLFASILLLMKKKIALLFFALSFLAIIIGNYYDVIMVNYYKGAGMGIVLPIFIFVAGLFLLYYTKKVKDKGFLS